MKSPGLSRPGHLLWQPTVACRSKKRRAKGSSPWSSVWMITGSRRMCCLVGVCNADI